MVLLRPSMTLVFDLDDRLAQKDTILELKRCYAYVGVPVMRNHAPETEDAPLRNTARMIVSMGTKRYLLSTDEGADELWEDVFSRWIGNMLHKVGTTMKAFNVRQRKINLPEVVFDRIDIELQGGSFVVALHTNPQSYIDFEMHEYVDLARKLLNDGTLGAAVRVEIPSDESYAEQCDSEFEQWILEHPEEEQEEDEAAQTEEAEAAEPERELTREEWLELDKQAKSYENTAVPPTDSDELPPIKREEKAPEPEPFEFAVDYRIWSVIDAEGTKRSFDSVSLSFIED